MSARHIVRDALPEHRIGREAIEPVMVIASPSNDGDRAEIPFSEASTATPSNAISCRLLCAMSLALAEKALPVSAYESAIPQ